MSLTVNVQTASWSPGACARHADVLLGSFLDAILRKTAASGAVLSIGIIYILRLRRVLCAPPEIGCADSGRKLLCDGDSSLPHCPHCLFLAALVVAFKFVRDDPYRNIHLARWGRIPLKNLNSLELSLLKCLKYEMFVPQEELETIARLVFSVPAEGQRDRPASQQHSIKVRPEYIVLRILLTPWRQRHEEEPAPMGTQEEESLLPTPPITPRPVTPMPPISPTSQAHSLLYDIDMNATNVFTNYTCHNIPTRLTADMSTIGSHNYNRDQIQLSVKEHIEQLQFTTPTHSLYQKRRYAPY